MILKSKIFFAIIVFIHLSLPVASQENSLSKPGTLMSPFDLGYLGKALSKPLADKLSDLKKNFTLETGMANRYSWIDEDNMEALGISVLKSHEGFDDMKGGFISVEAAFYSQGSRIFTIHMRSVYEEGMSYNEALKAGASALRDVVKGNLVFVLNVKEIERTISFYYHGEEELPVESVTFRHIRSKVKGYPRIFQVIADTYLVLQMQFFEDDGSIETVRAVVYPQNYNPSPDSDFPMLRRIAQCRIDRPDCLMEEMYRYYGGEELLRDSEIDVRKFMQDHIVNNIFNNLLIRRFLDYLIQFFPQTQRF